MKPRYLFALLALSALVGCTEDDYNSTPNQEVRVYTTNSAQTKISMEEDVDVNHLKWSEGDYIILFTAKDQKEYTYQALANQNGVVEFQPIGASLPTDAEGETIYALYPNAVTTSISENTYKTVCFTRSISKQDMHANLYAKSKIENGEVHLQFKHILAYLKIILPKSKIDIDDIDSFRLNSSTDIGARNIVFDMENEEIVEYDTSTDVVLIYMQDVEIDDANIILYAAILPQSKNGILRLSYYSISERMYQFLFSRPIPTDGMKVGYMYTMDMGSDQIQLHRQQERNALIDLYNSTKGEQWPYQDNWCSDLPLEYWKGVSGIGNVVFLSLVDDELEGQLPGSLSILMDNAEGIDLRMNSLYGPIPNEIKMHPRWNDLGWSIITNQYPFGFETDGDFTNESPRRGFDLSEGTDLYLSDKELTLLDGSKTQLMPLIKKNKLTKIITPSRSSSPYVSIDEAAINQHLDYQNKGLGTIVEIGRYFADPIGDDWKEFAQNLPAENITFVEETDAYNSIIPQRVVGGFGGSTGDVYLVNSEGELVDHFDMSYGRNSKLDEWLYYKMDSVIRVYCGEPEEHPIYSHEMSGSAADAAIKKKLQH